MNIAIVGTGYVGLVSGTCFAEMVAHVRSLYFCGGDRVTFSLIQR